MIKKNQVLYTFRGRSPKQVAELCDLWQGSVVNCNRQLGIVQVKSDPLSFEQFSLFYALFEYLENCAPAEIHAGDPKSYH